MRLKDLVAALCGRANTLENQRIQKWEDNRLTNVCVRVIALENWHTRQRELLLKHHEKVKVQLERLQQLDCDDARAYLDALTEVTEEAKRVLQTLHARRAETEADLAGRINETQAEVARIETLIELHYA